MTKHPLTNQKFMFGVMVILFFIWGFITLLNDLLIPILKDELHLTYAEAMLVQFCFFFTYFAMSIPMSWILNKVNYKKGIIIGLCIIALGCLIFIPADFSLVYGVFLFGLFVLASGIVMLQVAANPLVTLLGAKETSPARLTLAQGLNSLGYVLAPIIVSGFIVSTPLYVMYILLALIIVSVAVLFAFFDFSKVEENLNIEAVEEHEAPFSLWHHGPFMLGLIGIFVYVGAEVTAGSLVVSFLHLPEIGNLSLHEGIRYLSIFWGGAMVGRLLGSYILTVFRAPLVLAFNATANIVLLLLVIFSSGYLAMWALLLLGIFNSIMFPTIFALAIENLPNEYLKNKASGYLIMAIFGGAVVPLSQGLLADIFGLQHSFMLLLVCYTLIVCYGLYINNLERKFS